MKEKKEGKANSRKDTGRSGDRVVLKKHPIAACGAKTERRKGNETERNVWTVF